MSFPQAALQSSLRRAAAAGRDTERIGPFLATFSPHSNHHTHNYAVPDDGAVPTPSDVDELTAAYRRRDLLPRLEYLTATAPAAEAVLAAGGYSVERRIPLMACAEADAVPPRAIDGIALRVPGTDAEFGQMYAAQNEAFGGAREATSDDIVRLRKLLADGGFAILAADRETGEIVGGGQASVPGDGMTELLGLAVREPYRRRGICVAMTAALTRFALDAGAHTPFLTPFGEREGRIYAKAGYRQHTEMLHLIRES
ncbi:GNAT family N-acetyltransferase [Amycolatopsis minnesotensis]|uniref:GNAT family N-acetyltransferase n=1 Tax=Amycolatopsis minnesotensis TaxID=337894 RepID=A0ABN2SDR3_9PSEU